MAPMRRDRGPVPGLNPDLVMDQGRESGPGLEPVLSRGLVPAAVLCQDR